MRAQSSAGPPAMIAGPWRAPSSPPETPIPMTRNGRPAALRRLVSWKFALPASITRSSGASSGASAASWSSTAAPAGTIRMIARGGRIAATKAARLSVGVMRGARSPALALKAWVTLVVRFQTAIGNPFSAMFSARAAPIVPRPISPIVGPFSGPFSGIFMAIVLRSC